MIDFKAVKSGLLKGAFKDRFGAECSAQEASYQEESCLWLGIERDQMGEEIPHGRMILTQEQARELAEVLLHFSNEGALGRYDDSHFRVGAWVRGIHKTNFGVLGRIIMADVGNSLTVQSQDTPGVAGHIHCIWSEVHRTWTPDEEPPAGRPLMQWLVEDDDD